jgi:hypothetical protein
VPRQPSVAGALETAALEGALRLVYVAMWIVAPDNPGRAMAIFVRCIDNTLAADVLSVGEMYEVTRVICATAITRCRGSVSSPWPASK